MEVCYFPRMMRFRTMFFLGLFWGALCLHATEFPLRDVAIRDAHLLASWHFLPVPEGQEDEVDGSDPALPRTEWKPVQVPAVWDQSPGEVRYPNPRQVGWFHTTHEVPAAWDGEIWLAFLGVKYTADVFVDGEYLAVHRGGYTPFLVPVGDATGEARTLSITVRVDNRLDEETIPKDRTGWETYGGITREVFLLHRPPTRPEDPFARSFRDDSGTWNLRVTAETTGSPATPLRLRLLDAEDAVAEVEITNWADGIDTTLSLTDPKLWSPDSPHRYQLEFRWGDEHMRFPVGIRELHWEDGRLHVNGEPIWLQGFGQHEFYPRAGPILSSAQRREDLHLMKTVYGANTLRTGHYPNHPEIFALADELGLLTFTEVPAWQSPARLLAQDDIWETWLEPQLTAMVYRYRNTIGLFGWGVLNETTGAHTYIQRAREHILEIDPTRPVAAVIAKDGDFRVNQITDLAARNLHYGWYHSRSVYDLREGLDLNLRAARGRPLWVAELGGQARPGRLGGGYSDDVRGTETYQDKMTRFGLQYILSQADRVAGISLWTWSDYRRDQRAHDHGVLGPDRSPKVAAYTALNLMRPPFRALALESETVIPAGEDFNAELFVFAMQPAPGKSMRLIWEIRHGDTRVLRGHEDVILTDGYATPAGNVIWTVPETIDANLHHLYLELRDADGRLLHSQALPFEPGETTRPGVLKVAPPADGAPRQITVAGMTLTVYPHTGLLLPLPPGEFEARGDEWIQPFTIAPARFTDLSWD